MKQRGLGSECIELSSLLLSVSLVPLSTALMCQFQFAPTLYKLMLILQGLEVRSLVALAAAECVKQFCTTSCLHLDLNHLQVLHIQSLAKSRLCLWLRAMMIFTLRRLATSVFVLFCFVLLMYGTFKYHCYSKCVSKIS